MDEQLHGVQQHFVEALARRAAAQDGAVRSLLQARVATLQRDMAAAGTAHAARCGQRTAATPGPLGRLVAQLAAQPSPALEPGAPPDLKTVEYFRDTWTRLGAERRLAQSQAALPGNAGPLNSQLLVHRALTLMRETSPGYLQRTMGYLEALVWLDQRPAVAPPKPPARPRAPKKPGKGKAA